MLLFILVILKSKSAKTQLEIQVGISNSNSNSAIFLSNKMHCRAHVFPPRVCAAGTVKAMLKEFRLPSRCVEVETAHPYVPDAHSWSRTVRIELS